MQTPLGQGALQVLPSGGVRLVTSREREEEGRDEGQPGTVLQEEVGREGPAHEAL